MTFPNAFQGVKRLFNSEILKLFATACTLVAAIAGVLTISAMQGDSTAGAIGGGIITTVFGLGATVLLVVAYVLKLVGLKKAGIDEPKFQSAFILAIIALILSVAASILSSFNIGNGILDRIIQVFATVADIFITLMIIQGVQNLALKLDKEEIMNSGSKLLFIIVIFYALGAIATLIPIFFGENAATATISGILSVVGSVLRLIAYIVFILYLSKAKKMLAAN